MRRRFNTLRAPFALAIFALVGLTSSCDKKQSSGGGSNPAVIQPPVSTDHILFAHLDAKALLGSPLAKELMDAFAREDQSALKDIEREFANDIGVLITTVESATLVMPAVADGHRGGPPLVVIVATNAAIDKRNVFRGRLKASPDRSGFYKAMDGMLAHFPDDKTMVLLHPDFVEPYLSGYAKDRSAWPMNAALMKAAEGHTAYVALNPGKLPAEAREGREVERFLPLFEAKSAELTIDLRGKELALSLRGTFASNAAANSAKAALEKLLQEAASGISEAWSTPRQQEELALVMPLIKEAHRAVTEARVVVNGTDISVATTYKADFNVGEVVKVAIEKVRTAAARVTSQNNLRIIGIGMHAHHDATKRLPVGGLGKNLEPIRDPKGMPLLSWRVAILPYIEEAALYREFKLDEPWDSEHNRKLISRMPKYFHPVPKLAEPGKTHLQQIVGPTCMNANVGNFNGITDGLSNTIAVIEAAEPVIWTKPDDVFFPEKDYSAPPPKDLKKKFGGIFPNGINVLMWDGSVRYIDSRYVSDQTLWNLLRPSDGNVIGSDF